MLRCHIKMNPSINQTKVEVWGPGLPFPCHNKVGCLHRLWYRESLSHIPNNDTFCQVDSWFLTSNTTMVEVWNDISIRLALTSALASAYNGSTSSVPLADRSSGLSHYHLLSQWTPHHISYTHTFSRLDSPLLFYLLIRCLFSLLSYKVEPKD